MRILFINRVFPGQFGALAASFAAQPHNEVLFMSGHARRGFSLPGVRQVILQPVREKKNAGRSDMASEADRALRTARQALKSFRLLQRNDFTPDIVILSAAWDCWLYGPEVFPGAFVVCYPEDFARPTSDDVSFRPDFFRSLLQDRQILRSHLCITRALGEENLCTGSVRNAVSLPYPVDTEFFSPRPGGGAAAQGPLLFMTGEAGRIDPVLHAAGALLGRLPQRRMVLLVSDPAARGLAKEKLQQSALAHERRLVLPDTMPLRDYRDLLRSAALVIFADRHPGVSFLLEAMSCGTAVLLCSQAGQPDVLQHGRNIFRLDLQGLALQTVTLLQDDSLLENLRTRARRTVLEHFSLGRATARHMQVIAEYFYRK